MRLNDGGYSRVQYTPRLLRAKAKEVAACLPALMHSTGATSVVVTGKSGIAMAFAVCMLIDINIVVVRKRGENSHGNPIEGADGTCLGDYLVLDDFVSSGETVRNIRDSIEERERLGGCKTKAHCVGVLQYLLNGVDEKPAVAPGVSKRLGVPCYEMPSTQYRM